MYVKKGDIVGRISYGKDILFSIKKIIKLSNGKQIAILKGVTVRIEADSPIEDLELIEKDQIKRNVDHLDETLKLRIKTKNILQRNDTPNKTYTGIILHLDGDRKYAEKSYRYYKEFGLNAIVKNIPENKQSYFVSQLLSRYNPDIVVITGHDAMIKNGKNYNDIYNYRNSRHFINTVKEARKWAKEKKDLVIFARSLSKLF